ncbi:carbon starvation protein A [Gemmatimonadota bacterium]
MNAALLLLLAIIALLIGYIFYGRFLSRRLGIDPGRTTPAHTREDGIDYVPARAPVLFGHHFASIAGAAPIIGPVTAAVFGWIPVLLWVLIGSIFLGGAHDMSSLVASIRHRGNSIGEIIEENIGVSGKTFFLIFALATLILVIAVFAAIVARTFTENPSAASASILFILLAVAFGQVLHRMKLPLGASTLVGVILLFLCVWLGLEMPLQAGSNLWLWLLMGYIFLASITPVWALLQPRDYLNSFLLFALLGGAVVGIVVQQPVIRLPAFTGFNNDQLGFMFPVLFVTVACGAISGFHSLVASGTTAKQLNSERDARVIGYGGMLTEGLLAVVALATAAVLTSGDYVARFAAGPITIFSEGVGGFVSSLGIDPVVGTSFAALAVSAFALTTLDTGTRLGRYAFAELFTHTVSGAATGKSTSPGTEASATLPSSPPAWTQNRWIGSGLIVAASALLAFSGQWQVIWPIFGSANQLLAALALLAVSAWLARQGKRALFTRIPMYFMFTVTLTALITFAYRNLADGKIFMGFLSILLFTLAVVLAILAFRSLRNGPPTSSRSSAESTTGATENTGADSQAGAEVEGVVPESEAVTSTEPPEGITG